MKSFFKAKHKPTIAGLITEFFGESQSWREKEDDLEPLIELIRLIRPLKNRELETVDLQEIISFLRKMILVENDFLYTSKKF